VVIVLGLALSASAEDLDPSKLPPPADAPVDFERDIRPILENSCYRCHTGERPRSRYNLATRETALRGGTLGVAIIPGNSAQSPLIHYVARVIEGMEMPPPGRDAPLTDDQVSLLRAWIDQGAMFPEAEAVPAPAATTAKLSLDFQYFSVSGNEAKFREHGWMPDGAAGGILEFSTQEPVGEDGRVTMTGRLLPGLEDYEITLGYEKKDLGWVRGGYSQYRRWFDGTGGYYEPFGEPPYQLDDDRLYLDTSRAWIEFGLDRPRLPQITLGYEYLLREGERPTLQWGLVRDTSTLPPVTRAIYPASKQVEEQVHVIRLDVRYDLAGFLIEDNFRGEFADLRSDRANVDSSTLGAAQPDFVTRYQEGFRYFEGANTLRIEKQARDWLFLSGGYLYSNLDGEASFNSESFVPADPSVGPFVGAAADEIVLRRESNVVNVNAQLGPWEDITFAAGAQADWIRQEGFGTATIAGFPSPLDANLNRQAISEHLTLRFTGLPYTVLHAEARLQQENVDQFEQQTINDPVGNASDFLRDTEARSDLWEARTGFTISPWTFLSLDGSYRRASRDTSYDHARDLDASGLPGNGYPAFILGRDVVSDDWQARLVWRATRWLKTTFKYQHVNTRIDNRTDDVANPLTGIVIPGGRIRSGDYEADIYSVGASLSPWRRLVLNATFSFSDAETATGLDAASVTPYEGCVYSLISSATFALDAKTDLTAAYSFSKSDYDPDRTVDSLPLGLEYDRHGLVAGIRRQFKHGLSASLQYAFYRYDEPTSGGALDYTAHGILVGFTKTLR
jgi:hypothetical protein